jgi:bifunctional non-homologous end joining protein LigD
MHPESISLFYKEGNSDKVYQAQLLQQGTEWVVNFQYGRRGSTLATGTKTNSPTYQIAKDAYDKLIRSKMAKGYTEDSSGTVYSSVLTQAQATGIFPQLLNHIEEDEVDKYLDDDNWMMQPKIDGKRILIRFDGSRLEPINRRGLTCAIPEVILQALAPISINKGSKYDSWIIDGECVGDIYHAFDLLEMNGLEYKSETAKTRYERLCYTLHSIVKNSNNVVTIENAIGYQEKRSLFRLLKATNQEGVVFKNIYSQYKPGRPNKLGDQLKYKFVATASVFVTHINDKRSFGMGVYEKGVQVISIGNCTVPPNHKLPKVGDICEVKYLYAYKNGSLYQPVYLGIRDDVIHRACTIKQLKYKAENLDSEEVE